MVASLTDRGFGEYQVEAAISKVFASECLWRTVDEGLQIAAGNGYMCEYPYERAMRDSRINRIFEGTNDVLRLFIALTGMNDVSQELRELEGSLKGVFNDPIKGFGVISEAALRRAALATGIKREGTAFTKLHVSLTPFAAQFEDHVRDLATASDRILRKHGRKIIEMQFATRRLADIMIDLFVLGCVMSRVDAATRAKGEDGAKTERHILTTFAGQARRRIKTTMAEIDDNEDESLKALADHTFDLEKFGWDTL
jgi:alkylation response protein AidB-like acyl-CoA dehydrogenase